MLLQQDIDHTDISYHMYEFTLADVEKRRRAGQTVLDLRIGAHQDPGIRRRHRPNEDTIHITRGLTPSLSSHLKPFVLLVVADGMGGQGHGQEASQIAVKSLTEYISGSLCAQQSPPEDFLPLLRAGVQSANRVVYERNHHQGTAMGTTMTAVLIIDATAYVAHVGDSRLYLYRESTGLVQVTRDHSAVAVLVAEGIIAPEDIYTHPMRNRIYRSLGEEATVEVDAYVVPLAAGGSLLLCSEGVGQRVRDPQIAAIVATRMSTPPDTAQALIQAALAGGGDDNVSAIVAQVSNV